MTQRYGLQFSIGLSAKAKKCDNLLLFFYAKFALTKLYVLNMIFYTAMTSPGIRTRNPCKGRTPRLLSYRDRFPFPTKIPKCKILLF